MYTHSAVNSALPLTGCPEGYTETSNNATITYPLNNWKRCSICDEAFGRFCNRPTVCFKCKKNACPHHSRESRYNFHTAKLGRVCDECIHCERKIIVRSKLTNFSLSHSKKLLGIKPQSREYTEYGLRNKAKVVVLNGRNVEEYDAQTVANTLNTIDLPFEITLDFMEGEEEPMSELKAEIGIIEQKMVAFNSKYDKSTLCEIFAPNSRTAQKQTKDGSDGHTQTATGIDGGYHKVEDELKGFHRRLREIEKYELGQTQTCLEDGSKGNHSNWMETAVVNVIAMFIEGA